MHKFFWFGAVILVIWAVLWLVFKVVSVVVHVLLFAAVVLIVWGVLKRGANAVKRAL